MGTATEASVIVARVVRQLQLAIAAESPAVERLTYAQTSVSLRLADSKEGVTLRLQDDDVAILDHPSDAEIEVTLSPAELRGFADGGLLLQRALARGSATHRGPLWKFLRVTAILQALLRDLPRQASTPVTPAGPPREPDGMWAIECRDLHKAFRGEPVLEGVDLKIPEGLITVVLGPSGTGKSVLLKHTIGLLKPDRGEVFVRARAVSGMSPSELMLMRRDFGVLFQDGALWAASSVGENVAFPLRQHTDLSEPEIAEIVAAMLADVGLAAAADRMPEQLSGGMRKRAGLARAIALEPQIMLFDEPDSGLDPVRTALLCDLIAALHARHGGTFIVVTHDISVLRRIAHYVAVLWNGRIVAADFADQILASDDAFVRQFLSGETVGPLAMD